MMRYGGVWIWATASVVMVASLGKTAEAAFIQPVRSQRGMVVSAHPFASEAGLNMMKRGGNAIDAAVATAFMLSVVEPYSAGIGGGGFALVRFQQNQQITSLDFRERAPLKATRNLYLDGSGKVRPRASLDGHLAVGVPGTVAGLAELHRRYGKLSWQEVVDPAIQAAEQGFGVSDRLVQRIRQRQEQLSKNPAASAIFLKNGQPYGVGERLIQRDLAKTLRQIARDRQSFYQGDIAQAIVRDMQKNQGIVSLQDLQTYRVIERTPVCGNFRTTRVCSMAPPSSGGVHLLQMLNLIGNTPFKAKGWNSPDNLHLLIESMRIAYADRSEHLGDPDFSKIPVQALISPAYARLRRAQIPPEQARPSQSVKPVSLEQLQQLPAESADTTHLSVVDGDRNAVSLTFTINGNFGAGVVAEGTGILLNNEMDDFATIPGVPNLFGLVGGEANAIAPRKTPLSSMTPTIVTENGQLKLVVGAPGGSTIITTVLQVVLNVLEYQMNAGEAVSAPRIHHQWQPDLVYVEPFGLEAATLAELRRRGHQLQERSPWGNATAIVVTRPENASQTILEGAADPRGEGAAVGF